MSDVWFISDTHFSHRLVADIRGFTSPEAHDEHVVDVWNSHVARNDIVWHMGDVGMGRLSRFAGTVDRLHGSHIHLVTGNHDECAPGVNRDAHKHQRAWMEHFGSVQPFARRRVNGHPVVMSHYPYSGEGDRDQPDRYREFRLRNEGVALIHGHTHDEGQRVSFDDGTAMVHVGFDAWGRPVHIDEVAAAVGN